MAGGSHTRRLGCRRRVRRDARRDRGTRSRRRRRSPFEDPSGPQPLRRGRGRDQRRARERLRRQPRGACVRHRQGLRLPGRPGRDPDPLRRGARRRVPARALGRGLLAHRGWAHRAAAVRRSRCASNGVRSRHHRTRSDPRPLRAGHEARPPGVRGVLRLEARGRRRPLPGRDRLGSPERRAEDDRRQDGRPRHRRRGPALHGHDERLRLHGRRNGDGLAGGSAAQGHGDDAVSSDDALADRGSDHRGDTRGGCVPPELGGRPLPEELRAERDGAGQPGRHLAGGAGRDRRGPRRQRERAARHAPPRGGEDLRAPARDARAGDDLRRHRPDLRADPGAARRPLPHGRRRHRPRAGHHRARRPVRGRRVRVRLRPRREPARRERAHGDDHLRPARRCSRGRLGPDAHDRGRSAWGRGRRASAS